MLPSRDRQAGYVHGAMLIIKNPTASTVQYTISTRSQPSTFASYAWRLLLLLTRIAGVATAVLILSWQYNCTVAAVPSGPTFWLDRALTKVVSKGETPIQLSIFSHLCLFAFCIVIMWLVCRRGYVEESLLVIQGLGVQTSTSSASYLSPGSTRFIPTTAIQDIFIHEAFIGFKVKFYLCIVVENEDKVVVVFPNTLPRLNALETVWRGARACLYEAKT